VNETSQQQSRVVGIAAWKAMVGFTWRYFSVSGLLKTILTPFRRDTITKRESGYSVFERFVWNIFVRLFGAIIRIPLILIGIISTLFVVFLFPLFVIPIIKVDKNKLRRHKPIGTDLQYGFTTFLKEHARDLARVPEVPLIGKQKVLEQVERVLGRESQNNVLLVGEPGVGRTTLLEQLAKHLQWGDAFPQLRYRHIFELQVEGLTKEETQRLMNEAAAAGNIIVVINDIQNYPSLIDMLIPYTKTEDLQIVAVTDFGGYHQRLKYRSDFLQAFEKVEVGEPGAEDVARLLVAIALGHEVEIKPEVAGEIVKLTNQLVHNIPQPEKSIDVLEELLVSEKDSITKEDVHALLSEKSGVPVGELSKRERDVLMNLESIIKKYVVGQDKAIEGIANVMRRARAGITDEERPIGSFIFAGPTGVGKTYTAQVLSRVYYGSFEAVVHFDMTEYNRAGDVGKLTERLIVAMEENPFTLILFDEVEKAHPQVINLFLQILEEAHITDDSGRRAHFNNALIVCTSNAGSNRLIQEPNLGEEELIEHMIKEKIFSPEFLNRFDGVIVFSPFTEEQAMEVARRMLTEFSEDLKKKKDINIRFEAGILEILAKEAINSKFGAREIRREIENTIEGYVAQRIIAGDLSDGGEILIPASLL